MELVGAGLTDTGCKRSENEDHFLCDAAAGLFIVADGMGGRARGEIASNIVVTLLPLMLQERVAGGRVLPAEALAALLHDVLCQLSDNLYQQSQKRPELQGMGSTAAVLLLRDRMAQVAYAGDSRVYLLRDAELIRLTEDQTTAAALVRDGSLSAAEALRHPLRHALEEYIGREGCLSPGRRAEKLCAGDRWLLCSDGLTKGLPENALRELLLQRPTPEDACQTLIATANAADGTDNITVVVVDVTGTH